MIQVLLDLDGTLVDSLPGIERAINHALEDVGRAPVPPARLRGFVGSPLRAIFRDLLGDPDRESIERVVAAYRARFEVDGLVGCDAFPGIRDTLDALLDAGHPMRIATVKPTATAERVLERLKLDHYFASVHGADPHEHATRKADIVGAALAAAGAAAADAVMVGDRADDVRAARQNGIRSIGVRWGYGHADELVEAGVDTLVNAPSDIVAWLQRHMAS